MAWERLSVEGASPEMDRLYLDTMISMGLPTKFYRRRFQLSLARHRLGSSVGYVIDAIKSRIPKKTPQLH